MIAQTSPLKLINFTLFDLQYALEIPEDDNPDKDWSEFIPNYVIDIEFDHMPQQDDFFEVYVQIEVNLTDKPLPGFQLAAGGVGVFQLSKDENLDPSLANNLRVFSSLNICINSIRNEFSSVTSQSPLGRYYLPAIDIASLIQQKRAEVGKEEKARKKRTKKSIK